MVDLKRLYLSVLHTLLFLPLFSFGQVELKIRTLGQGSASGAGSYVKNSSVTLSATPKAGYEFKGWSGDLAGKENPLIFTISSNITANAHFEPIQQNIVYINGHAALGGSYLGKLNNQGRRALQRRVNRVGSTRVHRRNKVLQDLVTIEYDFDAKLKDNVNADDVSVEKLNELSEKKSAMKGHGVESQIKEMMDSGNYEFVEPNWLIELNAAPSDSAFSNGKLWGLRNLGQSGGKNGIDMNTVQAWDLTTGSESIIVAVIDTGILYTHQDLKSNMWKNPGEIAGNGIDDDGNGYIDDVNGINAIIKSPNSPKKGNPIDDNGHGTHVAGTIGAQANGGGEMVGVAWRTQLMALKFLASDGRGYISNSITCIDYAIANGARVINASYGGGGFSRSTENAIKRARDAGIVFVAAAGNNRNNNDSKNYYPCGYEVNNVICVSAIDRSGKLASFSNYGLKNADLGAPGVLIYSTYHSSNRSYRSLSGTSMAAPHVAGAAALLLSREPNLSPSQVRQRLIDTASPLSSLKNRTVSGGMLDIHAALLAAPQEQLRLDVTYLPDLPVQGEPFSISARVVAGQPILGATVQAKLTNLQTITLLDNGIGADKVANDGTYASSVTTPARSSIDLIVTASHSSYQGVSRNFPIKTMRRPANDSFAQALPLSTPSTSTTGQNSGASVENNEPLFEQGVTSTVWYSWRPSNDGQAKLSTHGSSFDTTLAVYLGTSLQNLKETASNDDSKDKQFTSEVSFPAFAEQLYYIQVGGIREGSGDFTLNHPAPTPIIPPPPPEKIFPPQIKSKPEDITRIEGQSLDLLVSVEGTAPFSYKWILNGQAIIGATQASYAIPRLSLEDSGEYSIMVTNKRGADIATIANLTVRATKEVPANDDIENAEILFGEMGTVFANTRNATGQTGEPNHAGASSPLGSVWWKWTAPQDGTISFNTEGKGFDTTLAAYLLQTSESSRRAKNIAAIEKPTLLPASSDNPAQLVWPAHGLQPGSRLLIEGLIGSKESVGEFIVHPKSADLLELKNTTGQVSLRLSPTATFKKLP